MDILELPSIPRERAVLQNLINTARRDRKIRRLKYWAAAIISIIALFVLMNRPSTGATSQDGSGRTESTQQVSEVGFDIENSLDSGELAEMIVFMPIIWRE
jgi:hypothetical protein